MELCQAIKDSNEVFADAMSDMSKSFMLMAETMKVSIQQMAMIQQQQHYSMISAYQPGHNFHLYSAQQAQRRPIFHIMNNAHQPKIMSTPQQTMSINAPPHTMNAPHQTMNSQKDATSEINLVVIAVRCFLVRYLYIQPCNSFMIPFRFFNIKH